MITEIFETKKNFGVTAVLLGIGLILIGTGKDAMSFSVWSYSPFRIIMNVDMFIYTFGMMIVAFLFAFWLGRYTARKEIQDTASESI
jgi:hypothetical protein